MICSCTRRVYIIAYRVVSTVPLRRSSITRPSITGTRWLTSTQTEAKGGQRWFSGGWKWFGIPASLGITCLALLQLERTLRRESRLTKSREPETWQLALFRQLPARLLSRTWGYLTAKDLPVWLRRPLLGLYVWAFSCNMGEAEEQSLREYSSLLALFMRELKEGARSISHDHPLLSPSDGKVLHHGRVWDKKVEQVKGITYHLDRFLGPESSNKERLEHKTDLYHIVIYLAPGDYHHFHSPTTWNIRKRRHFPGELLTVAPWAARKMPGLFALNERAVLYGDWEHGFFSLAAVGAYNVGSIQLTVDEDLQTNQKGHYKMGEYTDKQLGTNGGGLLLQKGDKLGCFRMGSSIVLIFEAPREFKFLVEPGQTVLYGQPLGSIECKTAGT